MPTITKTEATQRVSRFQKSQPQYITKSASQVLFSESKAQSAEKTYDIFLSHASADAAMILGTKLLIEDLGYCVYIDWLEDPELDRSKVTSKNVNVLRARMRLCKCLFFATTANSATSKWMPWECGYVDGQKGKVAILPITDTADLSFDGQEYLSVYPYVLKAESALDKRMKLWVHEAMSTYVEFEAWLKGSRPTEH